VDLNQLAVFVKVVDSGSMTKAAALLKQPKSRVSRRIATLEKLLRVSLLYRNTRQLSLTQAGRTLYERCRHSIYELERATEVLHESSHEVSGPLRVTASEDIGSSLLGPLIVELGKLYPKLSIELILANEVMDLVKDGIDLALRIGPLEDATLKARLVGYVGLILVASPNYLSSHPPISKVSDLSQHSTLFFNVGEEKNSWKLKPRGKRETRVEIHTRHSANHPNILLALAIAGQGVALIPEFICVDALASGKLVRILEEYETVPAPVHFVWPAHRETNPKVRAFVEQGLKQLSQYLPTK
jgi:DNA-binding transcriptional LysR family regulator